MGAAQQRYEAAQLDIQSALGEALARLKTARQADALVARKALPEGRAALKFTHQPAWITPAISAAAYRLDGLRGRCHVVHMELING